MRYGLDLLGLAKYSDDTIKAFPAGFGVGCFTFVDGFGDALPKLERLLKTGKVTFCRLQLMWKDRHDFNTGNDLKFVAKECDRILPLMRRYPNVEWYVSPCCEHRLNTQKWNIFAGVVSRKLTGVRFTLVNSPEKALAIDGVINEAHHVKPFGKRRAFSYDGKNCTDSDVEKDKREHAGAEYFMFWNCQANGRFSSDPKKDPTPRAQRKHYPVPDQILGWAFLANSKGPTSLPPQVIFKPFADQHESPDGKPKGKDQKPAILKLPKYRRIEFKKNGKTVATAPYFGTYEGGGHRYYFGDWGHKIAKKAGGNFVCDVVADGKKIGALNPNFRDGSYR